MKVLQLSVHFKPNIGGVETHLSDLVNYLTKKKWEVIVVTYKPLVNNIKCSVYEKKGFLTIIRIPWIGGLFYKFINNPFLEFVYLVPGIFIVTPLLLVLFNPQVIHSHGLIAGFIGTFWGKIFRKKIIISTHSIYNFPKKGLYRNFVEFIFNKADFIFGLSKQSVNELKTLGINEAKINNFTYWVDLKRFNKVINAKKDLGWNGEFVVLFVGRLVQEKGIIELIESSKNWNSGIYLKIIGSGPLENEIKRKVCKLSNIEFIGGIDSDKLPIYYSGADLLVVPSVHEEGFGRVILESLACGTPVIGSKRGAIPEALDLSVGRLIDITIENIVKEINMLQKNKKLVTNMRIKARKFAEMKYSEDNANIIVNEYTNK